MEQPFRDIIAMFETIISQLHVDFVLTDEVKSMFVCLSPELVIFSLKLLHSGPQFPNYIGILQPDVKTNNLWQRHGKGPSIRADSRTYEIHRDHRHRAYQRASKCFHKGKFRGFDPAMDNDKS